MRALSDTPDVVAVEVQGRQVALLIHLAGLVRQLSSAVASRPAEPGQLLQLRAVSAALADASQRLKVSAGCDDAV